jgi:hypothetical protein
MIIVVPLDFHSSFHSSQEQGGIIMCTGAGKGATANFTLFTQDAMLEYVTVVEELKRSLSSCWRASTR